MATRDEKIGPTAHYTAYVWRRIGMPHAELFATRRGAALFWGFRLAGEWAAALAPGVPTMTQYLAMRHRLIEEGLAELRPDRVVEIGAGLSRRGLTWAADHDVDYVEVDLPHMVAAKRARLEAAPAALRTRADSRLTLASHDVLDPGFARFLAGHLRGAARPVVIAEGLLGYFPLTERARIVSAVREAFGAGEGALLCDLRTIREGGRSIAVGVAVLKAGIQLVTRGRGVSEDFATHDDIRRFFVDAGFRDAEPLDHRRLADLAHLTSPAGVWRARV